MTRAAPAAEHVDVLIVGAGISGIGAAWRLQEKCPGKNYVILEAREAVGGTWDLFRYPGVRSDSDMYTLGFPFRPWRGDAAIADGAAIRAYIEETAQAGGIDRHIRFEHRVTRASWSPSEARWTVDVETADGARRFTCAFLYLGSGYYDYGEGYRPEWPGEAAFSGWIVHPQFWPGDLDHDGKRIVVIGSGATAVTLAPALAATAAKVTLLQRSPSYIVSRPARDRLAPRIGARLTRLKNVLLGMLFFSRSRRNPQGVRRLLLKMVADELPGHDIDRDFSPAYNPWDQRVCLVPDGDLFAAIRGGKVEMMTDTIETFTETGIRLASGRTLDADIVVTATGLVMKLLGGIVLEVDGEPVNLADRVGYKGMMLNDVPNLVLSFGYTNASWTLKSDLTARYFCRLIGHMGRHKLDIAVPRLPAEGVARQPMLDFSSGYVQRAAGSLPAQGTELPWRTHQNYFRDMALFGWGTVTDPAMEFRKAR